MYKLIIIAIAQLGLYACSATNSTKFSDAQTLTAQQTIKNAQNDKYQTYVRVGQLMPVRQFSTIDGTTIDLSADHSLKLIIFFATWCSDSQRAMKALSQSSLVRQENLSIIGVARENSIEEVIQFKQEYDLDFPLVADVDRSIYRQFASAGIPRFIMLNQQNQIVNSELAEGDNQLSLIKWE